MKFVKTIIKKIILNFGFEIRRKPKNVKPNPIHLWDDDIFFNQIYDKIKSYTLVDKKRCFMIYQLIRQILDLNGDFAEVGVYKGGTAKLISEISKRKPNKKFYLFDTFTGMPPTDPERDFHQQGDFSDINFSEVKHYLENNNDIKIFKGFFPDTADPIKDKIFSFVHIDVDIYKSVTDCCKFFYPRMVTGGVMIFDDYGFLSCPGAKEAVDDFFINKKENIIYLPTGQCLIIKK